MKQTLINWGLFAILIGAGAFFGYSAFMLVMGVSSIY